MDIRSNSSPAEYTANLESRARQEGDRRARLAEQDAQERINRANQHAKEAQEELEQRSEHLRSSGDAQLKADRQRIEQQIEAHKKQGYQQLAELKRKHDAEMSRTKGEAERRETELKEHYQRDLDEVTRTSSKAVRDAYVQNLRAYEQQDASFKSQREALQQMESDRLQTQKNHYDLAAESQLNQARAGERQLREKIEDSRVASHQHYNEKFSQTIQNQQQSLNRLNSESNRQLQDLRDEHAQKLAKFDSRAEDPFYKMVNLDTRLRETDEAFILTARIPTHEQENVKAYVQGKQIVLSGARRNEDQLTTPEGRTRNTATYQNFRETFPIDWPVEPNSMLREAKGDRLTFTFPKRAGMVDPETGKKKSLEYQAQRPLRPDFPENLISPAPVRNNKPIG